MWQTSSAGIVILNFAGELIFSNSWSITGLLLVAAVIRQTIFEKGSIHEEYQNQLMFYDRSMAILWTFNNVLVKDWWYCHFIECGFGNTKFKTQNTEFFFFI